MRIVSASSRDGGDEYSSEASEFDTTKNVSTMYEISETTSAAMMLMMIAFS